MRVDSFNEKELKELEHVLLQIPPGESYNYMVLNDVSRKIEVELRAIKRRKEILRDYSKK